MKEKIAKKMKNRKFRRVVISAGLIIGIGLNNKLEQKYETKATPVINNVISNELEMIDTDTTEETTYEELKDDIADKIIYEYNKLGNNLQKENLGCVLQTNEGTSYLFIDQNGNYVFDITQNTDGLHRIDDNYNILIFIDKTKENKPIASVGKINEQEVKVNTKSVDINGSRSIQDSNNYLSDIKINYDEALGYLYVRGAMIK